MSRHTYTTDAVLDVTLNNPRTRYPVRCGHPVAVVKETGSYTSTLPVIEVPDDSPGFVFSVSSARPSAKAAYHRHPAPSSTHEWPM